MGWVTGSEHAEKRRRVKARSRRAKGWGEEQRVNSVWAEEAGEVRVMTGTHAGLYLPDVCGVHTVLSSAPISFLSHYALDPTLHQSLFLTHSLPLFLPITGPWKKKIGQPLCKEERRSGEGGGGVTVSWGKKKRLKQSLLDRNKQSLCEWVGGIMKLASELHAGKRRVQIHKNNESRKTMKTKA